MSMIKINSLFKKKKQVTDEAFWKSNAAAENDTKIADKLEGFSSSIRKYWMIGAGLLVITAIAILGYVLLHVGSSYVTLSETKRTDISGSVYTEFGDHFLRYSSDGVSSLTSHGDVMWKATFSMQSPMIDICGSTAVIADQKGSQIYIFNEDGPLGQFQTPLPIEKVRVAKQGVVIAILEDKEVTWINFYDTKGREIVKNRTSLDVSGYPLDVALSPDGLKLMVSYLCVTQGIMNSKVAFYNFDSVGQTEINNVVNSVTYENAVVPKVAFIDKNICVAFKSNGFSIFGGKQIPELKKEVDFEGEILSAFHDSKYLGFVFASDVPEHKYKLKLYDMSGRQTLTKYFDINYKQVKIEENNILLFNDSKLEVYSTTGRKKFSGTYKKAILDIISVKGFRKFMVLTQDSTDMIRLK